MPPPGRWRWALAMVLTTTAFSFANLTQHHSPVSLPPLSRMDSQIYAPGLRIPRGKWITPTWACHDTAPDDPPPSQAPISVPGSWSTLTRNETKQPDPSHPSDCAIDHMVSRTKYIKKPDPSCIYYDTLPCVAARREAYVLIISSFCSFRTCASFTVFTNSF